jgi:hypothetical protein
MIERLIIPNNIGKNRITAQFGNYQVPSGAASNEGTDIIDYVNLAISEGLIGLGGIPSGSGNLSLGTITTTTLTVDIDSGTSVTLPSATTLLAGLLSATDKIKLNNLVNYIHPNHSGHVTSTGDGATVITNGVVTNAKLASVAAYTIKSNPTGAPATVTDFAIGTNQIVGRGTGNIVGLTLGANLAITGSTLDTVGSSFTDEAAQDAIGSILLDTADIEFTYDDATPNISALLSTTGVIVDTYGSNLGSAYSRFTVDSKGRITSASEVTISLLSTAITDFSEAVDDRVSTLLVAGSNIGLVYNDVANTLTINNTAPGYNTIQYAGSALAQQSIFNFTASGFVVTNDGANSRTNIGLTSTLAQLSLIVSGGFFMINSSGGVDVRQITTSGDGISVVNGNGYSGHPTLSLDLVGGFQNLTAPVADRLFFYDQSAGISTFLELGSGLSITGTTLNAAVSGVLNDLTDVTITTPSTGQILRYNGTQWVNYTHNFVSLVDVPDPGDMLYYHAGQWFVITPLTEVFISLTGNSVTLANVISPNTKPKVYFNGSRLEEGSDYSINYSSGEITFIVSFVPLDKVLVDYFTAT